MTRWWHLYGAAVPNRGYSFQVMLGDCAADEQAVRRDQPTYRSGDILGAGPDVELPLLGSWDHRPTIAEVNAVLPADMEPGIQADNADEYGDIIDDGDEW